MLIGFPEEYGYMVTAILMNLLIKDLSIMSV